MENKYFVIAVSDDSEFYIPEAEHIERNDEYMLVNDDIEASAIAEHRFGVKLIYGMRFVPDGVYVDTPENRKIIKKALELYPEYKKWGETK